MKIAVTQQPDWLCTGDKAVDPCRCLLNLMWCLCTPPGASLFEVNKITVFYRTVFHELHSSRFLIPRANPHLLHLAPNMGPTVDWSCDVLANLQRQKCIWDPSAYCLDKTLSVFRKCTHLVVYPAIHARHSHSVGWRWDFCSRLEWTTISCCSV